LFIMAVTLGDQPAREPEPSDEPSEAHPELPVGAHRRSARVVGTLSVAAVYLSAAFLVSGRLWADVARSTPAVNPQDHVFFQWAIAYGARVVSDGAYPFATTDLNMPAGVNLMANTSILGLGIPLAPITLAWGPQASFALLLVLGLAGTAFGWYWLFSRHLVRSRPVAFVAGALCGFAPGMISHSQGHVNWTAQFLVPPILIMVIRLARGGSVVRDGLILGVLVAYQAFINEEVLLYAALAASVFLAAYAAMGGVRGQVREHLLRLTKGVGLAAAAAAVLLAYPLYVQFFGPQSYHGVPTDVKDVSSDLASYAAFPRLSLAGDTATAVRLAQGPAEENSFLGWPLLLACAASVALCYRNAVAWALAITGAVFTALSLGPAVVVGGRETGIPGPWRLLAELPIFNAVVPTRLALITAPIAAGLLALGADRALTLARARHGAAAAALRLATVAVVAVALIPLVPRPIPAATTPALPAFITAGTWREYVTPGTSMVVVPVTNNIHLDGMRWSTRSDPMIPIAGGYFLGPSADGGRAIFNAPRRATDVFLERVSKTGRMPRVLSLSQQRAFYADVRYWKAAVLVMPPGLKNADAVRRALDRLAGPSRFVGGTWIWDVRYIR
jgi:hypothetical protein